MGRRNPERRTRKGDSVARIDREVMLCRESNGRRRCEWLFFRDTNKRYPADVVRELRKIRGDGRPPKIANRLNERSLTSMLADLFG